MEVKLPTGIELAKLQDGQLVYGTYEEVENYDYSKSKPKGTFNTRGVNQDKW